MALRRCYNSWFGFGLRPKRHDEFFLNNGAELGFGLRPKRHDEFFLNNGAELLEELITSSLGKSSPIRIFSAQELEKATNNYADDLLIREGFYCNTYKGTIDDRAIILSKVTQSDMKGPSRAFEVAVLSRINHVNIVKILGCCLETKIPILVYEFFSHETLYDRISKAAGTSCYISWKNCLKIATGVAYGLTYLHIEMATPIIHRDIKSSKILLDERCNVKIIGFERSLSMPLGETETTCEITGTVGYLDPCYFERQQVSEKSDVYSYGVVVFEILTGKNDEELWESASEFFGCTEEKLVGFAEASLLKEAKKDQLMAFAQLVRRCLSGSWEERPTMKEVVQELRRIKGL